MTPRQNQSLLNCMVKPADILDFFHCIYTTRNIPKNYVFGIIKF